MHVPFKYFSIVMTNLKCLISIKIYFKKQSFFLPSWISDRHKISTGKFNDFLVIFQYGPMMKISTNGDGPLGFVISYNKLE
jgi:hypothetical protein